MLRLALRTLRLRKTAFAATFAAMVVGAAVVVACAGLLETGVRFDVPPQRLAAAPVVVAGNHETTLPDGSTAALGERVRLSPDVVAAVAAVPGVAAAVPDSGFDVTVGTAPAGGRGWASAVLGPYTLDSGAAPGDGEVVLDAATARAAGVGVGATVPVLVHGVPRQFTVSGIATPPSTSAAPPATAFFADPAALSGESRIDAVGVLPAPGADTAALAAAVSAAVAGSGAVVLTGDDRGLAEFPQAPARGLDLLVIAGVFGGMAIIVALFGSASMLTLAVQQRNREMALLRAIGADPAQLRRMVLGEAVVVAAVAAAVAVVPGRFLGEWLFGQLSSSGLAPEATAYRESWLTTAVAVLVSLLAAAGASVVAGRRAANAKPVRALATAEEPVRWFTKTRLVLALVCFWIALAGFVVTLTVMTGPVTAATAGPIVLWAMLGVVLLGPGVAKMLLKVFGPAAGVLGLAGRLAALNSRVRLGRVAAVVAPVMLMTGFATADIYMGTSETQVTKSAYTERLDADLVLLAPAGGFADGFEERVTATPGVAAASRFTASTGYITSPADSAQTTAGWPLQGIDGTGAVSADVAEGSLSKLTGDTVALSTEHAARLGATVGDRVTLRFGDGSDADLALVALFVAEPTFDDVLLPADTLLAHTTSGTADQVLVKAEPGADLARLGAALGALGAVVADRSTVEEIYGDAVDTQVLATYLAVGVIVVYTGIVAVNTTASATAGRRREFALQRLVGATKGQVLRMVAAESLLVGAMGAVLGTIAAAVALTAFGLSRTGTPVPSGPVWIYPAVVAGSFAVTLVAALVPAWLALRTPPARAAATD